MIGGDSPDFQGIWNQYFKAGGTNTDIGPSNVGNVTGGPGNLHANMNYVDTYDVKYTGYEFETTLSPTQNLRFQLHYSKPKGQKENDGPNAARYFAQHIATWQAAAGGANPDATTLATMLTNAQNSINAVRVPTITGHLIKEMFNVFGTYSFSDGALKGFQVGAGAAHIGEQYGNPWDQVNGQRTLSPGYTTYSALIGYQRNFDFGNRRIRARLQLNVDNVTDVDRLVFVSYQAYGANQQLPMDYNMVAPRKYTISASFDF